MSPKNIFWKEIFYLYDFKIGKHNLKEQIGDLTTSIYYLLVPTKTIGTKDKQ